MPAPSVSVVVATHDRPERLARLLEALARQTLKPGRFEVIVVDDGSGPATAEVLRRAEAQGALAMRVVRLAGAQGPATARNRGWREARAALVAFTDDDCVPAPDWLTALLAASRRHPGRILQGPTEPHPSEPPGPNGLLVRTRRVETMGPSYEACNIAYPRAVLEDTGGFSEAFGAGSPGEDSELAWRALERGHRVTFVGGALVHHAVESMAPIQALREAARWGECARLFANHPAARRAILHRRLFWNVWHYLLIRSVAALQGPRWLRRLILTRHALTLLARTRRAGVGPQWIGYLIVHDAVETASCIQGGVRHRTPLL